MKIILKIYINLENSKNDKKMCAINNWREKFVLYIKENINDRFTNIWNFNVCNFYDNIISNLEKEKRQLVSENQELKQEVRNLKSSIDALKIDEKEITNVDIIRRISQLEKIVLGKEQ